MTYEVIRMETILKRLHITVPIEVFDEIYKKKDMDNIDNIVSMLLCDYYRIELTGSVSNGRRTEKDRK